MPAGVTVRTSASLGNQGGFFDTFQEPCENIIGLLMVSPVGLHRFPGWESVRRGFSLRWTVIDGDGTVAGYGILQGTHDM